MPTATFCNTTNLPDRFVERAFEWVKSSHVGDVEHIFLASVHHDYPPECDGWGNVFFARPAGISDISPAGVDVAINPVARYPYYRAADMTEDCIRDQIEELVEALAYGVTCVKEGEDHCHEASFVAMATVRQFRTEGAASLVRQWGEGCDNPPVRQPIDRMIDSQHAKGRLDLLEGSKSRQRGIDEYGCWIRREPHLKPASRAT